MAQKVGKNGTDFVLSAEDIRNFRENGVICLRGLIGPDQIEKIRGAVERDIANPGPNYYGYAGEDTADAADDKKGRFHGNQELWGLDQDFADYCISSQLPRLAGELMGVKKINLYFDHLFVKEPATSSSPTPWHNDQPYWPIAGHHVASFWLALDHVSKDSGAVEYIRGSHQWDRWFQPETFGKTSVHSYEQNPDYEPMPDIDANRSDYDILSWDMEPGDALAFHALTVHGAGGNTRQDRRRRGYAVRYIGEDVRYDPRPGTSKILHDEGLSAGGLLDSKRFPVVWRARGTNMGGTSTESAA